MKNSIFLICFLILSTCALGQNLNEAISLREKNIAFVEENLLSKGWHFMTGKSESDESYGFARFGLGKIKNTNNTGSIITIYYSKNPTRNRIDYQISSQEKYINAIKTIKANDYKLIDSKIVNGKLVKWYKNSSLTIEITISTEFLEESGLTFYSFLIADNTDYDLNLKP